VQERYSTKRVKGLHVWGAFLLLVSGIVLLIPSVYQGLSRATGERPWIQIIVGTTGIIVSLAMFAGKKEDVSG